MRSLAVPVLVGALLALLAGCDTGVSEQDTLSKEDQIERATVAPVGEPIPEDEKATPGVASENTPGVASENTPGVASENTPGVASKSTSGFASENTPGVASKSAAGVASKSAPGVASKNASAGDILGSWTGRYQDIDQILAQQLPGLSPEQKAQYKEILSQRWHSLELRGDGTFSMSESGGLTWSDTWEMNGETIVLASNSYNFEGRITKTGERTETITPNKKPRTLRISSDRAELIAVDPLTGLVFRRK